MLHHRQPCRREAAAALSAAEKQYMLTLVTAPMAAVVPTTRPPTAPPPRSRSAGWPSALGGAVSPSAMAPGLGSAVSEAQELRQSARMVAIIGRKMLDGVSFLIFRAFG